MKTKLDVSWEINGTIGNSTLTGERISVSHYDCGKLLATMYEAGRMVEAHGWKNVVSWSKYVDNDK